MVSRAWLHTWYGEMGESWRDRNEAGSEWGGGGGDGSQRPATADGSVDMLSA